MKTASLVLGIIGGVLAIIFAIMFMLSGAVFNSAASTVDGLGGAMDELTEQLEAEGFTVEENADLGELDSVINAGAGAVSATLYVCGILSIVGGILGIIGGALAKKKNIVAGILLVIAAVACLFTALGFLATILFVLAAIFAFIPDKSAPAVAA